MCVMNAGEQIEGTAERADNRKGLWPLCWLNLRGRTPAEADLFFL
jgi:hypothetical protein